jgi:hypothetical protein
VCINEFYDPAGNFVSAPVLAQAGQFPEGVANPSELIGFSTLLSVE